MSTLFVRPGHLHTASRVLSASTERGLMVQPATVGSSNRGQLRLRTSGMPLAEASLDVKLQTGGNPTGYTAESGSGVGRGSAVIWKRTTDSGSAGTLHWRGYIDTPYLVRVDFPVTYGTGFGRPSTPRTLANGKLGFCLHHNNAVASRVTFTSVDTDNVATTVDVDVTSTTSDNESDFVVLPDGSLVLIRKSGTTSLVRHESTDHGATWSSGIACGITDAGLDCMAMEYTEDLITMVLSSRTGAVATEVRISRDGGYNWTTVDSAQTLERVGTCVTPSGKILVISTAAAPLVQEIGPGGGISTATVATGLTATTSSKCTIATRDDGTVWAWAWNSAAGTQCDLDCSVSIDGGATFTHVDVVMDENTLLGNGGYRTIRAGSWAGRIVMLAQTRISGGGASDYNIHLLTFGGWESVTEQGQGLGVVYPYEHVYVPIDFPDAHTTAWTRTDTGAGATVTNAGPLKFVSTGANATYYLAPTSVLAATGAGDTKRVRVRCRQVSGGGLAASSNGIRLSIADGAGNHQGFILRTNTTTFRVVDVAATFSDDTTVDMTKWTDFLFAFKHDNVANTSGLLSCWYKQDADETWTLAFAAATIGESAVAGNSQLRIGGSSAVAGEWDLAYVGIADNSNTMEGGFTNPDDLVGRPLSADVDYEVLDGLRLGGRNGGGTPGDTYTVATGYQFGKESIWRELRPSRKVHSSADNASWSVVFDAGADLFKGDVVGLFGTNFRTAKLQLNAANSWGGPSVSLDLDATLDSTTVGLGNRGPGYVGVSAAKRWVPGRYRSDGDGHRYFVEVGGAVYEIADNDETRLYVTGVDFSAAAGTFYIFGDKMGLTTTFVQYRYMRVLVAAQQTADNRYHLGTVIFDKSYTPGTLYDNGFVDRITPQVLTFETDNGYQSSARSGPRRHSLSIQWRPVNALLTKEATLEEELRAFYSALEGGLRPFLFWRDTTDVSTLGLYTLAGVYQATNLRGELKTALTRIDQLTLEEVL